LKFFFNRLFGIDLRSLALFRIALGCCVLGDLATRATALEAHYTDFGILPRSVVVDNFWNPANVSLHLINGSVTGQAILFFVAAVFGAMMLVGFYTRVATIASWVLLVSLQLRNPLVLQGGDILFRSLLFWAMFLPLGARLSIDAAGAKGHRRPTRVLSVATAALLLQVALMYWCTAALKRGKEWIPDGTAIYYALHIEEFAKPFGIWLRQFPEPLHGLTYGVWGYEVLGPFLLFLPVFFLPFRLLGILGFVGLHIGLYSCMELGIFPFISAISMIPFIPCEVWETLALWREDHLLGLSSFADSLRQSIDKRVSALSLPGPLAWAGTGTTEFRSVAWQTGTGTRAVSVQDLPREQSNFWFWTGNAFCALFFVYVVFWNLAGIPAMKLAVPDRIHWVADLFRLDQYWDMFAPYPAREDGWWVVPGTLEDGSEVDVLHQTPSAPSWEAPERISASFANDRWRSYSMMIWLVENESYRLYYAQYLCRLWNRSAPEGKRLKWFQAYFMSKPVLPDYQRSVPEKVLTWEQDCD
jgi:hypothetical protein